MDKILQRSKGKLDIQIKNNKPIKLYQSGSSKILTPNSYKNMNELVLINTSGGVTCNDSNSININLANSNTSICTQAAEKIYAGIGDPANINIDITLNNSDLFWLPKELILFNKAKLKRIINFHLDKKSNLILCETSIFGRKAMSETIDSLFFSDIWKITIDKKINHLESININNMSRNFKNKFTFNNHSALSTILIFGNFVDKFHHDLKKIINNINNINCEISIWDNKIVIRSIAEDNYKLKKSLKYILENIIYDKIPQTWYL